MASIGNKLGKLSIAILENFVEGTLGKKFVEELRAPTDRTLTIHTALEHTEGIFRKNFEDRDLAHAIFVDLPTDPRRLRSVIVNFFNHPTDPDFSKDLENLLTSEFKNLSRERVQVAVEFYIKTLKQELALVDPNFREKIRLLADLETLEHIRKIEKYQKDQLPKETLAGIYENVQLILDGDFQEFDETKQNEVIVVLSALLHTETKNIKVMRVIPGSIIIEIKLESTLVSQLSYLVEQENLRLSELGVIGIRLSNGRYISAVASSHPSLATSAKSSGSQTTEKLKVFIAHAYEDKPIVKGLYDDLVIAGYEPWLDSEFLLPGMDWDLEIKKSMRASDAVIVCFSSVLIEKEGYIQKELKFAQDIQEEKLRGSIFLIPLLLDSSEIPFVFREIHWTSYTEPDSFEKLIRALNKRARQLGKKEGKVKKNRP